MATPLNRFANVAFRPPAKVSPRKKTALPMLPKVLPQQALRRCLFLASERANPASRKPRRLCRGRIVAHLFRLAWLAVRLSLRIPPRKFPRRFAPSGAAFRSFEPMCRLSASLVDSAGEMSQATLPTWRVVQLARHARFFLRQTSQLPGEIIDGDSARIADRADFSPAPVCVLESGHGDSAKATTPLDWFANVAFRERRFSLSCTGKSAGEDAMPMLPICPLRAMSSPMPVFPSRWGRLQRSKNGADCFETASSPNCYAALGLRPV